MTPEDSAGPRGPGGGFPSPRLAGDVDYELHGIGYAVRRRTDPRIAARVHAVLGDAASVLNVGAGSGSYEPGDRRVVAVEPSRAMREQRPAGSAPVVDAVAEALPFVDDAFDAVMATVTIHQWTEWERGLRELRRVGRGPVVVLTFDPAALHGWWLADYAADMLTGEARRLPPIDRVVDVLGGRGEVVDVPIPHDCVDGFMEAYYARPEAFLDPAVRAAQSAWSFVSADEVSRIVARLRDDLANGTWDDRHGPLRSRPELAGSLRLIVSTP